MSIDTTVSRWLDTRPDFSAAIGSVVRECRQLGHGKYTRTVCGLRVSIEISPIVCPIVSAA